MCTSVREKFVCASCVRSMSAHSLCSGCATVMTKVWLSMARLSFISAKWDTMAALRKSAR